MDNSKNSTWTAADELQSQIDSTMEFQTTSQDFNDSQLDLPMADQSQDFLMDDSTTSNLPPDIKSHMAIIAPCVVDNLDEFLKCCGGRDSVQKFFKLPRERLRFKFRPKDLNTSPLYSNRRNATDLAVKVKRKRKAGGEYEYSIETMGVIDVLFDFEGLLCDFQLLPAKRDICDDLLKWDFVMKCDHNFSLEGDSSNTIMKQHNYSRFTSPRSIYRELLIDDHEKSDFMIQHRKSRSCLGVFIKWEDPVPPEMPEGLKERNPILPHVAELSRRIGEFFAARPIFHRPTLMTLLKAKAWNVKQTLPHHAYFYTTGPFRNCWVRYGYDPRKEKESKIYQAIDCRNKNNNQESLRSRLSIFKDHSVIQKTEITGNSYVDETISFTDQLSSAGLASDSRILLSSGSKPSIPDKILKSDDLPEMTITAAEVLAKSTDHYFVPGKVSMFRHNLYQICDIKMDDIQALTHENDGEETECKEKDGWLAEGALELIRRKMLSAMNEMLESDQLKKISLEDGEVIANFHVGDDLIEDEMMEIFENLE